MLLKKLALAVAVGFAITGCSEPMSDYERYQLDQFDREVEAKAVSDAQKQLESDKEELAKIKQDLKDQGVNVKDAYFSVNEDGERQLVIIREENDGFGVREFIAGAAVGALTSALVSNYMMNQQNSRYKSANQYEKEKKERSSSYGGYVASRANTNAFNATKNSGKYRSLASKGLISRSSAAFGGTGARSAGYGFGG